MAADILHATALVPAEADRPPALAGSTPHPSAKLTPFIQAWLSATNPNTARANARALDRFTAWAEAPSSSEAVWRLLADPASPTHPASRPEFAEEVLADYRRHLERDTPVRASTRTDEIGYSSNSIRAYILGICGLLRVLRRVGVIAWTPQVSLPPINAYNRRVTAGIGVDGFQRLLQAALARRSPFRERDHAILALTWRGLRVGEIADLDVAHLRLSATPPVVNILGKWRYAREDVELAASQETAIRAWLAVRGSAAGPLFWRLDRGSPDAAAEPQRRRRERRTTGGKRLTPNGIWRTFQELGKSVGLPPEACHPHAVRHTVATELLNRSDGNIRMCMSFMRLTKAEVVEIYDEYRQHRGLQGAEILEGIVTASAAPDLVITSAFCAMPTVSPATVDDATTT